MPRLSDELYYQRHRFLRKAWQHFKVLYAILPVAQQWKVHSYYQPSRAIPEDELIARREAATEADPTLPSVAGKAFNKLYRAFRIAYKEAAGDDMKFIAAIKRFLPPEAQTTGGRIIAGSKRRVHIFSVAKPEPDVEKLARAIMMLAEDMADQKRRRM